MRVPCTDLGIALGFHAVMMMKHCLRYSSLYYSAFLRRAIVISYGSAEILWRSVFKVEAECTKIIFTGRVIKKARDCSFTI